MKVEVKIIGISGSPRQNGNTEIMVKEALRGAADQGDVETEFIGLANKNIHPCSGCGVCSQEDRCSLEDDFMTIYRKMIDADGIILGSPVYAGCVTALCKALMERSYYGHARERAEQGKVYLPLRIGGAIAIGGSRHGGHETTLQAINQYFMRNEMIPIGVTSPTGQIGVTGIAEGLGEVVNDTSYRIKRPIDNLEIAWMYGRKVSIATKILKAGIQETGFEIPNIDRPEANALKKRKLLKVKIFGVSGSPRKEGNTEILVKEALNGAAQIEDVETDFFTVAGKNIRLCQNCGSCYVTGECKYHDGAQEYVDKALEADGVIIGTPVYNANPGPVLPLISRYHYLTAKQLLEMKPGMPYRMKPFGHIAVGGGRHGGQETSLQALTNNRTLCEGFPIAMVAPFHELGLSAIAMNEGRVRKDEWYEPVLKRKISSLELARAYGKKISIVASIVKMGRQVTGLDYVDVPLGRNMKGGPYPCDFTVKQEIVGKAAGGKEKG